MISSWTFAVDRDDLSRTTLVANSIPGPRAGEALLRVDRVGLTANNVTDPVLGEAMRYWEFFPAQAADELTDRDLSGALTVVLSSASSRTAYATAFQLRGRGSQIVGLTSADNAAFVAELGCYDRVLTYQAIDQLDPARATAYVDLAGHQGIRTALRRHLGRGLVRDIAVGFPHQVPEARNAEDSFFAPVRIRKRAHDWGRDGLDARFSQARLRFAPLAETAAVVTVDFGPQALRAAWLEVLDGRTPPRVGRVIAL